MNEALIFFGFIVVSAIVIALVALIAYFIKECNNPVTHMGGSELFGLLIGTIVYVIAIAGIYLGFYMHPEGFGYQKIVEEETVDDSPNIPEYVYIMDQNGELHKVEVEE